ncbi:MAG: hypothetical protein ACP5VP_04240 [Candidatus Limnocylindrales bacterium]
MSMGTVTPALAGPRHARIEEVSTDHLIRRIRWNRAVKRARTPGSPLWQAADARERRLVAALQGRFGVTTITPDGLDWLLLGERRGDRIA